MTANEKQTTYEKVPTKELINENEEIPKTYGYGVRHIQVLIFFLCLSTGYIARSHLGVTVVAMTKELPKIKPTVNIIADNIETTTFMNQYEDITKVTTNDEINKNYIETSTSNNFENVTMNKEMTDTYDVETTTVLNELTNKSNEEESDSMWNVYKTYEWPKDIQDMILSSFFLGYCIMMFPMGLVCQRWGGKLPLQISLLINGITSVLTPTLANWGGWKAVCFCRILQGLSQAGTYPSLHTLLGKWVPLSERASLSSYVYTGSTFGTVIGFQLGGLLADGSAGWPATFWATGVLCFICFALITIFGAATPADHRSITNEEKHFILGQVDDASSKKRASTPWKSIFKSVPVWASITTHIASGVCFVFLFTQIPTYMHHILGFDIKNSGVLSSMPFIASFLASIGFGWLSDFCTTREYVSIKNSRIISNSLAQYIPAISLVAVTFTDNEIFAVFLLILSMTMYAGVHAGWMVNYIDLSPNFSGPLMAMGNTASSLTVLSLPVLLRIVSDPSNRTQWRTLLAIMAAAMTACNTFYVFYTTTDTQPWNEVEEEDDSEKPNTLDKEKNNK